MSDEMNEYNPGLTEELRTNLAQLMEYVETANQYAALLQTQDIELNQKLESFKDELDSQYANLREQLNHFEQVLAAANMDIWRKSAEKALQETKEQTETIKDYSKAFVRIAEESCMRLDAVATQAETRIDRTVRAFPLEHIKRLAQETENYLDEAADMAISKMSRRMRWFSWRVALLTLAATLFSSTVTISYVNGDWPWQLHADKRFERDLGRAIIDNWSKFTPQEKQYIQKLLLPRPK